MRRSVRFVLVFCLLVSLSAGAAAQRKQKRQAQEAWQTPYPAKLFEGLNYRLIGPFRGGRSAAVAGVPGKPMTFYFGATGGGVWQTGDGGSNWRNISDGHFGGSIGAVAVSEWDNAVIYAGGGEVTVRGNVAEGDGLWKSTDRGKSWQHMGLADTRHIVRIRIHPKDPDLVYVAALGHLFGPNQERGVFRSSDGGKTWKNVLFVNQDAGAVDLAMDPANPRILFASFWRVKRTPYSLESGGEGSGLWKSSDGGDTWTEITRSEGLPKGTIGISGVSVSPVDPDRVWAIIEAEDGGVFRSDDGGSIWSRVNEDRALRQRAWYYTRIYADTRDADKVYVINVRFWRSKDGGKSFASIRTPHGDHHDLWIDPDDGERMIVADDGGAQISFDGGESWSTYHNQPTAQFYRVSTDNHFPYRILAAQQDNSTVRISHRTRDNVISERDWEPTAGGESGHVVADPRNPEIVYGGSYGGFLTRANHTTGDNRLIDVWPDNPMGHGAADLKYRFQWNFPIFFSPHDAGTLYAAANVLFKTSDEGQTWTPISPDLTRNDKSKMGPSGGPITKDNTSVEYYGTIFAAAASQHEPGVIWCGSDDGLLQLTRDEGGSWQNVTPPEMPEWAMINSLDIDPFHPGGLYVAATCYKLDDFKPYLYKTEDYGKSWRTLTEGIADLHFTRVIRADPKRAGLLYAGTEAGMYVSFDDGAHWQPFQLNLPIVPITDLTLKDDDLVVATQGRSLWLLDDLTPLHQLTPARAQETVILFDPRVAFRMGGGTTEHPGNNGTNLAEGVLVNFYLEEAPAEVKQEAKTDDAQAAAASAAAASAEQPAAASPGKAVEAKAEPRIALTFMRQDGTVIDELATDAQEKSKKLKVSKGFNRYVWDMRGTDSEEFEGMVVWSGEMAGPKTPPGDYKLRLQAAGKSLEAPFTIAADPSSEAAAADLDAQFAFLSQVRDKLDQTHRAVKDIRTIRDQVERLTKPMKDDESRKAILDAGKALLDKLEPIEQALYQTKNRSPQDPLNFPIRLNDKLAGLNTAAGFGNYRPTEATLAVRDELFAAIDAELAKLKTVLETEVPAFNNLVHEAAVPAIHLDPEKSR